MQLSPRPRALAIALGLLALAPGPARSLRAEVTASSHLTIFNEPSSVNQGLRVIHPQTEVSATLGPVGVFAGYEMDAVSGATTRVYSPGATGVDAVSGATFADTRHAARGGLSFETASATVSASYSYGWENDYRSSAVSVSARGEFLQRNFGLGLSYTRNFDEVCDRQNALAQGLLELQPLATSAGCFTAGSTTTVTRPLAIHTFEPGLTWTATPLLLLEGGVTLQGLDGFQSNPYRAVLIGSQGRQPQERLPEHRQRYAAFLRAHHAVPLLKAAARVGARVYRDTWDLLAFSADGEWLEYLGPHLIAGLRGRYHKQGGAIFFRTAEGYRSRGPTGEYWTGDRELAPLTNLLAGAKIAFVKQAPRETKGWYEEIEIEARFDYIFYRGQAGLPNADRSRAQVMQAGATVRF